MRLNHALSDVFAGPSYVVILRALVDLPDGLERSIRDLARRAGVSHPTASRVLHDLADQGLATVRRVPPAEYFGLHSEHVLVPALRSLFAAERGLVDELRDLIRARLAVVAAQARIYGSAARGAMRRDSDVDIAVLAAPGAGPSLEPVLEALQGEIRIRFGVRASFLVDEGNLEDLVRAEPSEEGVWHQVQKEGVPV